MRKQSLIIAMVLIAIIIVGCSNSEEADTPSNESTGEETSEDNTSEDSENTNGDGPLIDTNNPHDERQELIKMIDEQKELLKLGFAKENTTTFEISTYRFIEEDDEPHYQVGHAETYRSENSDHSISLAAEPFICDEGLDAWSSDLDERESFSDDRIKGYYGHDEYGSSYIFLEHNDICYSAFISGDDDVYDEKDQRLLELLTKTIKTEAEGAYDPLYSRFTMNLDKIKLPYLNQDSTTLRHTGIAYSENKYDPDYSKTEVAYFIGEDMVAFGITDEEDPTKGKELIEELQTENGATVSKYEAVPSFHYFHWQDDGYTYMIDVPAEHREITDGEILEIIDSARGDERSFENLDFFQGIHDKADLDEDALEILEDYYY